MLTDLVHKNERAFEADVCLLPHGICDWTTTSLFATKTQVRVPEFVAEQAIIGALLLLLNKN